jgi:hypothetical protein
MKTILQIATLLVFVISIGSSANARPIASWPYDKLTAEADLIVIATPTIVKDTGKKTELPGGIRMTGDDNIPRPIPVVMMEATFEVLSILKGEAKGKDFIFHYWRLEPPSTEPVMNAAKLVSFDPNKKERYLLFLRREPEGDYSSLTGQIDPILGIKELGTYP